MVGKRRRSHFIVSCVSRVEFRHCCGTAHTECLYVVRPFRALALALEINVIKSEYLFGWCEERLSLFRLSKPITFLNAIERVRKRGKRFWRYCVHLKRRNRRRKNKSVSWLLVLVSPQDCGEYFLRRASLFSILSTNEVVFYFFLVQLNFCFKSTQKNLLTTKNSTNRYCFFSTDRNSCSIPFPFFALVFISISFFYYFVVFIVRVSITTNFENSSRFSYFKIIFLF